MIEKISAFLSKYSPGEPWWFGGASILVMIIIPFGIVFLSYYRLARKLAKKSGTKVRIKFM